jgi:hypothetical protein
MALDNFESLPGIIHELQDGGLQISVTNSAPLVLVMGTASKGVTGRKVPVIRSSESENQFGKAGSLVRGMYEARGGGSQNTFLLRIGAKSATLLGVGTADQALNPTSIETLLKDGSAGDAYFAKYISSDNHLQIKNANGIIVYDNNPGGDVIDLGEVIVSGDFNDGDDIGDPLDSEDFLSFPAVALADPIATLIEGDDGLAMSKMETYEALDDAYRSLENDEVDIVIPMNVYLDDKNVVDGASVVLGTTLPAGKNYPKANAPGDALGKMYKEEADGEWLYWWDTDSDGVAEIYPSAGLASASTKVDGSPLVASDFSEVNFAYQLANFCFSISVNDNEATGVIGTKGPKSYSAKDISNWIGKEPVISSAGTVVTQGSGLAGNKFMAGTPARDKGFAATYSGKMPSGANFLANADVVRDRAGHIIDIGKYISITAMPLTFFNNTDSNGFGYQAGMAAYYGGLYSALPANSSPTNKTISSVRAPFRISKSKLNSLAKFHYVAVKQKEDTLKISDAPTAARNDSDFTRLTTMRIVAEVVDSVRAVAEPYIGEPNTAPARVALETGMTRELARLQELGFIQRFEVKVSATVSQQIQGDATVELVIVPAFELKRITIITSLAKQ